MFPYNERPYSLNKQGKKLSMYKIELKLNSTWVNLFEDS
jgi:hypothetical protein